MKKIDLFFIATAVVFFALSGSAKAGTIIANTQHDAQSNQGGSWNRPAELFTVSATSTIESVTYMVKKGEADISSGHTGNLQQYWLINCANDAGTLYGWSYCHNFQGNYSGIYGITTHDYTYFNSLTSLTEITDNVDAGLTIEQATLYPGQKYILQPPTVTYYYDEALYIAYKTSDVTANASMVWNAMNTTAISSFGSDADLFFSINDNAGASVTFEPFIPTGYTASSTYGSINIGGIYDGGTSNGIQAHIESNDGLFIMNYMGPIVTATVGGEYTGTTVEIGDQVVDSFVISDLPNSIYEVYYYEYNMLTGAVTGGTVLASTTFTLSQEYNPTTQYPPSIYTAPTGTSTAVTTCDPEDSFFANSICHVMLFLFEPSGASLGRYQTLWGTIGKKPPFGYFTRSREALEGINTSTSSAFTFEDISALDTPVFTPLRNGVAMLLWILFGIWVFKRTAHLNF